MSTIYSSLFKKTEGKKGEGKYEFKIFFFLIFNVILSHFIFCSTLQFHSDLSYLCKIPFSGKYI